MWNDPIYDRTASDITNQTSKGFFNVIDWIRIRGNTAHVAALLRILRGVIVTQHTLITPILATIPTDTEINEFIEDIETIRLAMAGAGGLTLDPLYHSYGGNLAPDYTDVNEWEKDLNDLKNFLILSTRYQIYSGVANSGQSRMWQARFRKPVFSLPPGDLARHVRSGAAGAMAGAGINRQNGWRNY